MKKTTKRELLDAIMVLRATDPAGYEQIKNMAREMAEENRRGKTDEELRDWLIVQNYNHDVQTWKKGAS